MPASEDRRGKWKRRKRGGLSAARKPKQEEEDMEEEDEENNNHNNEEMDDVDNADELQQNGGVTPDPGHRIGEIGLHQTQ
ncbi:SWI/SNF complex subunit SWI3C isoform X2 [Capsella rubella]|uniref:SWI/SNF complex subunit SWI3C isoform X2 n=1 Tax=Capsella rubella TaxID=81985 RepID=UPI000CD4E6CA|nr:SWI/SNF complex subunit SWI3C isoform X2 [Capsella rubella]